MRYLPTLASIVAVLLAAGCVFRVPGRAIPWTVPAYLVAQFFFSVIAWWGLQTTDTSGSYLKFYACGFAAVLLSAIAVAIRMALIHPRPLAILLIAGAVLQSAAIAAIVWWELYKDFSGDVPAVCQIAAVQGAILAFCGAITLTVTATKAETELWTVAMALGIFWTAMSCLSWGYALGITRNRGVWIHLNDFLPSFLAVVAFAWLAYQLNGLQSELVRQEVVQQQVVHQ